MERRDKTQQIDWTRLRAFAKARFPSLPAEDLVQEAWLDVHSHDSESAGKSRFDKLKDALIRAASSDKFRRGTAILQAPKTTKNKKKGADEDWARPEPIRRPRSPGLPRSPKGLVPVRKPGSHIEHIPICEGEQATPLQRSMARRLSKEVLEPILKGGVVPSEQADALERAYESFFGTPPEYEWAKVLVEEIATAKKAKLALQAAKAVVAHPELVQTADTWSVTLQATKQGSDKYPQFRQSKQIPVRPVWVYRSESEALVALWGELQEGKPQIVGYVRFESAEWGSPDAYEDAVAWANMVLLRTIATVAERDSGLIPDYILDHHLITWLVGRMGFEGGGGPNHVSAATLLKWLVSPDELAAALEEYGRRVARGLHDDKADETEAKFSSLAERVRASVQRGRT